MRKNEHQEHLENLIFFGKDDFIRDIENLVSAVEGNANDLKWTYKIDGSPAVVIYNNFKGLRGHGVCLKYMNPEKCYTTNEEVDEAYNDADHPESFRDMLKWCISLSKQIPEGEAYQGDCLFTNDTLTNETIGGKNYLCFQPNKVVYGVLEGTEDWKMVGCASFGIALHTKYTGSIDHLEQSFNFKLDWFDGNENYYLMVVDADPLFKVKDSNIIKKEAEEIIKLANENEPSYVELFQHEFFDKYFMPVENYFLNTKGDKNLNAHAICKEIEKRIKESFKTDVKLRENLVKLEEIKGAIIDSVEIINKVINLKNKILAAIQYDPDEFATFYKTVNGDFEDAKTGEGFSVSDSKGEIFKIVDRTDFSTKNRDTEYSSGFKHEAIRLRKQRLLNEEKRVRAIFRILREESKTPPMGRDIFHSMCTEIAKHGYKIFVPETNEDLKKKIIKCIMSSPNVGKDANKLICDDKFDAPFLVKSIASKDFKFGDEISDDHLVVCFNKNYKLLKDDYSNLAVGMESWLRINSAVNNRNVSVILYYGEDHDKDSITFSMHISAKSVGYYNLLKNLCEDGNIGYTKLGEDGVEGQIRKLLTEKLGYLDGAGVVDDDGIKKYKLSNQRFAKITRSDSKKLENLIRATVKEITDGEDFIYKSNGHMDITGSEGINNSVLVTLSEAMVLLDVIESSDAAYVCIPEKQNFLFYDMIKVNGNDIEPISVKCPGTAYGHRPSALRYIANLKLKGNETYKKLMDIMKDPAFGDTANERIKNAFTEKAGGLRSFEDKAIELISADEDLMKALKDNFTGKQATVIINKGEVNIKYVPFSEMSLTLHKLSDISHGAVGMLWE